MAKDGNGKINNTQRKILANLAVEVLNGKVQQARGAFSEIPERLITSI